MVISQNINILYHFLIMIKDKKWQLNLIIFLQFYYFQNGILYFIKNCPFQNLGLHLIYISYIFQKGLKDRILPYYHNISSFNDECNVKKVYLDSKENICEYKFKAFLENSIINSIIIFIYK